MAVTSARSAGGEGGAGETTAPAEVGLLKTNVTATVAGVGPLMMPWSPHRPVIVAGGAGPSSPPLSSQPECTWPQRGGRCPFVANALISYVCVQNLDLCV